MQHIADDQFEPAATDEAMPELTAGEAVDILLSVLSDGLDHPEIWPIVPQFVDGVTDLVPELQRRLLAERYNPTRLSLFVLLAMAGAAQGQTQQMFDQVQSLSADHSQSPLAQGALFHLEGLTNPQDPKFNLQGKICAAPFVQLDVLERSTHQCCASWLGTSAGDLSTTPWEQVWNSDTAQAIRASVLDGTYRYCNKGACPKIQANELVPVEELAAGSTFWSTIMENQTTKLPVGPEVVNLAYDRTCNLSCPSCRTERFAADDAQRTAFDRMQQEAILPMLKGAKRVFVTGSGDPFASKNFRRLMEQLTVEDYPDLKFQIMTNGMLFTPAQWALFPALHRRTAVLKISIDAATGSTHELLRRGARWPVVFENMKFAGELTAAGMIDQFDLVFAVQADNFREMGDAVDLAKMVGATGIYFARITNWGTFTPEEYKSKAVFLPSHPDYAEFIACMQDDRLREPMVLLGDLAPFVEAERSQQRKFAA